MIIIHSRAVSKNEKEKGRKVKSKKEGKKQSKNERRQKETKQGANKLTMCYTLLRLLLLSIHKYRQIHVLTLPNPCCTASGYCQLA